MKKTLLLMLGLMLSVPVSAELVMYDDAWGENCYPSKNSYAVKLKNNTGKAIDFKLCLERKDGRWHCYMSSNVTPGEVEPKTWGYYVCNGTGESKWFWRDAGDYSTRLGDP